MPKDLYMPTYFVTSDATAQALAGKGLKVEHITPEAAATAAKAYTEQLGPKQPVSAMTVGK